MKRDSARLVLFLLSLVLASSSPAQILHEFQRPPRRAYGGLLLHGGSLYGTTSTGGTSGGGVLFRIDPATGVETTLANFAGSLGNQPTGGLVEHNGFLYGTTSGGLAFEDRNYPPLPFVEVGCGTIFKFEIATSTLSAAATLPTSCQQVQSGLILDGGFLYGTATDLLASPSYGTVFRINPTTGQLTTHASFNGTNGSNPISRLTSDGTSLFGTTIYGGINNTGTIFKVNIGTGAITTLASFSSAVFAPATYSRLVLYDGFLYGTMDSTGTSGRGIVYKIDANGGAITTVANFPSSSAGSRPHGGLALNGGYLYGTASDGGTNSEGTLFKVEISSSTLTTLASFGSATGSTPLGDLLLDGATLYGTTYDGPAAVFKVSLASESTINSLWVPNPNGAGFEPLGELLSVGDYFYGTTSGGGVYDRGTLFRYDPSAGTLTTLVSFNGTNGKNPAGKLTNIGEVLYGTTPFGGTSGCGTAYRYDLTSSTFTSLASLAYTSQGCRPWKGLAVYGNLLYGAAYEGGANLDGSVFVVDPASPSLTRLHSFADPYGYWPHGELVVDGTSLYGTTTEGLGNQVVVPGSGTIYKLETTTNAVTTETAFTSSSGPKFPTGSLVKSGNFFFGTSYQGGSSNLGTVYRFDPNAKSVSVWKSFTGTDGRYPYAGLVEKEGMLYGSTLGGGAGNFGSVFKISATDATLTTLASFNSTNGSSPLGLTEKNGVFYGVTRRGGTQGGGGVIFALDTNPPFGTPANLVATATSATQVQVTWNPVSGATLGYQIIRCLTLCTTEEEGQPAFASSTPFTDNVSANSAYLYRVRALRSSGSPSGFSNADYAATHAYSSETLSVGTTRVKSVHITELRTAVDAIRALANLGPHSYTDASLTGAPINAVHLTDLRSALEAARSTLLLSTLSYTNPTLVPGSTLVKAIDVNELRNATK